MVRKKIGGGEGSWGQEEFGTDEKSLGREKNLGPKIFCLALLHLAILDLSILDSSILNSAILDSAIWIWPSYH